MVHLRIVTPPDRTDQVIGILDCTPSVINIIQLPGAARRPDGDVVLADVAREDASVILEDLKRLNIHEDGSISLELIDTAISRHADAAEKHAPGAPADAVVWEEVEQHTSENVELSGVFLLFMVLAALIAAVGIFLDSEILIVGAMVVGPEFGPIAGLCVALISRRGRARRPLRASRSPSASRWPSAASTSRRLIFKATDLTPDDFRSGEHQVADLIASPDVFSVIVAVCAGAAGMLSLSTAKSGRPDRGSDLGHHDPRRRQHRRRRRLPGRGRMDSARWSSSASTSWPSSWPAPPCSPSSAGSTSDDGGTTCAPTTRRSRATAQRAPSDDQTSTFVRTFSTTASVNSVVVAVPPRSRVFTPVATVSSTPS